MAGNCFASLQVCTTRVTTLNLSGSPKLGAKNGYTTDAAIKLDVDVTISAGDDLEQKNGCGALIAAFKTPDRIKNLKLSLDLAEVDVALLAMLTGSPTIVSGGNVIGFEYPAVDDDLTNFTCCEFWTKAWDGAQQAVSSFTSPNVSYFHWVFPLCSWIQGKLTMDSGIMVFPVTGTSEENAHITANGPYDDWPAAVAAHGGVTHVGGVFLDANMPSVVCGGITVPGADS